MVSCYFIRTYSNNLILYKFKEHYILALLILLKTFESKNPSSCIYFFKVYLMHFLIKRYKEHIFSMRNFPHFFHINGLAFYFLNLKSGQ